MSVNRIRDAIRDKVKVIDVDGSYLERKLEQLQQSGRPVAPLGLPSSPPMGWVTVDEASYKDISSKIPKMLPGTVYSCILYSSILMYILYQVWCMRI